MKRLHIKTSNITLIKKHTYTNYFKAEQKARTLEKLKQRSKEFLPIRIPEFRYSHKQYSSLVTIESEFIKGRHLLFGDISIKDKHYFRMIIKHLVLREDEFSCIDYSNHNFIIHHLTKELYAVDEEGFGEHTISRRIRNYNSPTRDESVRYRPPQSPSVMAG